MFALLLVCIPNRAAAGNDDGVLLGNEAAMTGGAVTAVVNDGSAAWYNPAGIAAVQRDTLDLSGSATMLRIADTPALLQSSRGLRASGGYYELLGIPSAVTMVRRLESNLALGLGIFVPQLTSHTDRVSLEEPSADSIARFQLTQQESNQEYYGSVSLGISLASNLRLGFALFGTYRQFALTTQFFGGSERMGESIAAFGVAGLTSIQSVSLELGVGLQWELAPGWNIGISARSPGLLLGSLFRSTNTSFASSSHGLEFIPTDDGGLEPRADIVAPARFRFGLARRFAEGWIGVDTDFQHELSRPEIGIERRWTGGVRIGGRYEVNPQISIGAGLFTDLDATRHIVGLGETRLDFFGGTLGLELRNPHLLAGSESASDIVFVNTFALRYAAGTGLIGGLRFDTTHSERVGTVEVIPVATTVHEISLHLGSALHF